MQSDLTYAKNWKKDIPAGLVVFLVALPLCLGIALASGAPLFSGLITGIIGGVVVSFLSGSQLGVSGPAAGLTVIVLDGIEELKSFEVFLLAGVVAGVLQILMGFGRAGVIGLYFPSSVIRGMLAAIGLILILKQFPHLIGTDQDFLGDMAFFQPDGRTTFSEIAYALRKIDVGALIVGLMSLALMVIWDNNLKQKVSALKLIPGALLAVVFAVLMNLAFKAFQPALAIQEDHLVNLPVFSGPKDVVAQLRFPNFSQLSNPAVYTVGLTIAIVASLESLLSTEAVDKLDPHKRNTPRDRELKAQGVGNILSSMIGGLPMTTVIVRSSANINAGGQTRISSFVHGLLLLASVLFLARYMNLIPLSALAAVLVIVGFKLVTPKMVKVQWKLGIEQFLPYVVTIVIVLFTDLLIGVGVGLLVAIFFILKTNYESSYKIEKGMGPEQDVFEIELSQNTTFLNKASLMRELENLPENSTVVIDGSQSIFIDYDVLQAIRDFKESAAEERGIEVKLVDVPEVAAAIGH